MNVIKIPKDIEIRLQSIGRKASLILQIIEPHLEEAIARAPKETRIAALRRELESEFNYTFPRTVLKIRKRKNYDS